MPTSNIVLIASMEAKEAVTALPPDSDLAARFLAAAAVTKSHWLAPSEEDAFQAAVEAVYVLASEEEQERLLAEAESLQTLGAMLSGVPVDLAAVSVPENPVGLLKLWREFSA